MKQYDYKEAIRNDIREYLKEYNIIVTHLNRDDKEDFLRNDSVLLNKVTGRDSGGH